MRSCKFRQYRRINKQTAALESEYLLHFYVLLQPPQAEQDIIRLLNTFAALLAWAVQRKM